MEAVGGGQWGWASHRPTNPLAGRGRHVSLSLALELGSLNITIGVDALQANTRCVVKSIDSLSREAANWAPSRCGT